MATTRRAFLSSALAATAGLSISIPAAGAGLGTRRPARPGRRAAGDYFDWREVAPGCHVATGEGGNSLLVVGEGAALLVDCKNAPFGAALRREAESRGGPITHVVNTHHHADHTGGNHAFTQSAAVLAHRAARPRVADQLANYAGQARGGPGVVARSSSPNKDAVLADSTDLAGRADRLKPEAFAPTRDLASDAEELTVGGVTVKLFHAGPGHTDNDVVVHVPARGVLHTGDLVFRKLHPYIDPPAGGSTVGWQRSLARIIEACDAGTIVVPGHGDVTDALGVRDQSDYFDTLRRIVSHAKDVDGMTRDEAVNIRTGAFEGYGFEQLFPRAVGAVYDELSASGAR